MKPTWLAAGIAGALGLASLFPLGGSVRDGALAPEPWRGGDSLVIGVVLSPDDCFTCAVPAQELRRAVTGRRNVSVRVAVAGSDVHAVQQYLRRERITATVAHVGRWRFARQFGSLASPSVVVVRSDTVRLVRTFPSSSMQTFSADLAMAMRGDAIDGADPRS